MIICTENYPCEKWLTGLKLIWLTITYDKNSTQHCKNEKLLWGGNICLSIYFFRERMDFIFKHILPFSHMFFFESMEES